MRSRFGSTKAISLLSLSEVVWDKTTLLYLCVFACVWTPAGTDVLLSLVYWTEATKAAAQSIDLTMGSWTSKAYAASVLWCIALELLPSPCHLAFPSVRVYICTIRCSQCKHGCSSTMTATVKYVCNDVLFKWVNSWASVGGEVNWEHKTQWTRSICCGVIQLCKTRGVGYLFL